MDTTRLFREDAYQKSAPARVLHVDEDGGIVLNQTVFYAQSGGQPGDRGLVTTATGTVIPIENTVLSQDGQTVRHLLGAGEWSISIGEEVEVKLDWDNRHKLMRMHTALHLLSVAFPYPVTGGSIGAEKGRLDFDMPEVPENLSALEVQINQWIAQDHIVGDEWITEAELDARPEMVKTMKVKPPRGQGRIRLVRIGAVDETIDLQPCGGTHVKSTGEIGPIAFGKIQKKGKQNRRVNLVFA